MTDLPLTKAQIAELRKEFQDRECLALCDQAESAVDLAAKLEELEFAINLHEELWKLAKADLESQLQAEKEQSTTTDTVTVIICSQCNKPWPNAYVMFPDVCKCVVLAPRDEK